MALWTPTRLSSSVIQWGKPAGFTGLANNDPIPTWVDSSGFGVTAEQSVSGRRPTYKTAIVNGKAVARFDGSNDFLRISNVEFPETYSYFVVAKLNDASNAPIIGADGGEGWFGVDGSGNLELNAGGSDIGGAHTTGDWHIYAAECNGASSKVYVDGVQLGSTGNAGSGVPSVVYLGLQDDIGSAYLDGDIAEYLLVRGVLTTDQRQTLEGYLAHQYALNGNLAADHPYIGTPPVTQPLWDPTQAHPGELSRNRTWTLMHYKADAITGVVDTGNVTELACVSRGDHVSGFSGTMTSLLSVGAADPTYHVGARNGQPIVRFNGVDQVMQTEPPETSNTVSQVWEYMALKVTHNGGATQRIKEAAHTGSVYSDNEWSIDSSDELFFSGSSESNLGSPTVPMTGDEWHIIKVGYDEMTGNGLVSVDFGTPVEVAGGSVATVELFALLLGAGYDHTGPDFYRYAEMDFGEWLVTDRTYTVTLDAGYTLAEIEALFDGYIAWKWGLGDTLPSGHEWEFEPPQIGSDARGTLAAAIAQQYVLTAEMEIEEGTMVAANDTIRVYLRDVTHIDDGAVTSGLGGTVEIQDWTDPETVADSEPIVSHDDDDWYVDFSAPENGHYRVVAEFTAGGAQRTLAKELNVTDPET